VNYVESNNVDLTPINSIEHGHLEFFGHLGALCVVFVEEVAHHVCVVELGFGGGSEPL
jgi:hypothetical protein